MSARQNKPIGRALTRRGYKKQYAGRNPTCPGRLTGLVVGWLIGRGARWQRPDSRLENELRQQVGQRETELTRLRAQLAETGNARAAAEARHAASEKMLGEQRALQDKALLDLREAFKALSAEALKQSAPEFLRLAEQTFGKFQETAKGDLAQRQESIKTLVEPLKQQLETYQKRLQQSEAAAVLHARRGEKTTGTALAAKHDAGAGDPAVPAGIALESGARQDGARKRSGASSRRQA